jgi:hypothetical protein
MRLLDGVANVRACVEEGMLPIRPLDEQGGRMRKLVVVSVVAMVFLALGAGVALADDARIQCKSVPCYASGNNDLVLERKGNGKQDEIILRGGNDVVRADRYTDDKDVVEGGLGNDRIYVDDFSNFVPRTLGSDAVCPLRTGAIDTKEAGLVPGRGLELLTALCRGLKRSGVPRRTPLTGSSEPAGAPGNPL